MTPAAPLLVRGARSIGPGIHRLPIPQLLLATLVAGIDWRSAGQLLVALSDRADLRAGALVLASLAVLSARGPHRRALFPACLASLRRQPLDEGGFALLVPPWAFPLAWPWMLILGLGHPAEPAVAIAAGLLGALCLCGTASAGTVRAALVGDPPVLLLDEPWAAIDAEGAAVVDALLEERRAGSTVLLATHGEARVAIDSTVEIAASRARGPSAPPGPAMAYRADGPGRRAGRRGR